MGLGGGSIFTIKDINGNVKIISSRETVPSTVKPNLLSECHNKDGNGSQWIGVPGEIRGYEHVHKLYGRLPWADLFQPTIKLAREGVPISSVLKRYLNLTNNSPLLRQLFQDAEGNLLNEGDIVKFERLADTLEKIANNGSEAFYTGDISRDLINDIKDAGDGRWAITEKDLRLFNVSESQAWNVSVGDYTLYFPPPPAGGVTLSFILKVMQGYHLNSASVQGEHQVLTYHRYIEAFKFAKGLLSYMKDPKFHSQAVSGVLQEEVAERIRSLISSNMTHEAAYYNITPYMDTQGTSHVSVLAEDGMAVAVTSTINSGFGSKVFSPKTGVLLNNELFDFCNKTSRIQPGERPPSSMAPMILSSTKNNHTVIIGGSGGKTITTGMAMALMNYLWFGKSLKESITAPVVYVDSNNMLRFEPAFNKEVIKDLQELGHSVNNSSYVFYNVVNAVSKRGDCIEAFSDTRKNGIPSGY
ncbi:gamma-glutamyltransferase 5a isoform X2 [Brachyhypopomus gauderio]